MALQRCPGSGLQLLWGSESNGRHLPRSNDPRSRAILVEIHRKRHVLVFRERLRIRSSTGADRNDVRTFLEDLGIPIAHLTGAFAARQSTKVSEEQHDPDLIRPQIAQSLLATVRINQNLICQLLHVETQCNLSERGRSITKPGLAICGRRDSGGLNTGRGFACR